MANIKLSNLTALGAAPATGDLIPLVDVSDTSQAASGTTKRMTVANLFTGPTITSGLTVSSGTTAVQALTTTTVVASSFIEAGATQYLGWTGRSIASSPSDGVIRLTNNAASDFGRLQFGGTTSSFPALYRNGTKLECVLADLSLNAPFQCAAFTATTGTFSGDVTADDLFCAAGGSFQVTGRGSLSASADGVWRFANNAVDGFSRLQFGGTTSSFPAIKRSGTALNFRLADDSAACDITCAGATVGSLVSSGALSATTGTFSGAVSMTALTATTGTFTGLIQTTVTTEQLRLQYDTNNRFTATVASDGDTNLDVVGASDATLRLTSAGAVGVSVSHNATDPRLSFFGATPAAKPTITGSRGGNAALANLLTELATLGLLTDGTS